MSASWRSVLLVLIMVVAVAGGVAAAASSSGSTPSPTIKLQQMLAKAKRATVEVEAGTQKGPDGVFASDDRHSEFGSGFFISPTEVVTGHFSVRSPESSISANCHMTGLRPDSPITTPSSTRCIPSARETAVRFVHCCANSLWTQTIRSPGSTWTQWLSSTHRSKVSEATTGHCWISC